MDEGALSKRMVSTTLKTADAIHRERDIGGHLKSLYMKFLFIHYIKLFSSNDIISKLQFEFTVFFCKQGKKGLRMGSVFAMHGVLQVYLFWSGWVKARFLIFIKMTKLRALCNFLQNTSNLG